MKAKKKINILLLILNLYNNEFVNIIEIIKFELIKLNKKVLIKINKIKYIIYVFIIIFVKNIKQ